MLLIFDWDGTLSDSAEKIARCIQLASERSGLSIPTVEAAKNIIGLGLKEALFTLHPEASDEQCEQMRQHYSRIFVHEDEVQPGFFTGVLEGLQQLKDEGYQLAVATGKSRKGLDRVLSYWSLEDLFHGSRCADETESKPHPKMLEELLQEFDRSKDQALMVGDTEYDMAMAHAIGMPRVAVSYGVHTLERMAKYEPDYSFGHFPDFVIWVRETYPNV